MGQDCWVAAAALRHGACLCTTNLKDFDYFPGLRIATSEAPCACSLEAQDVTPVDTRIARQIATAATEKSRSLEAQDVTPVDTRSARLIATAATEKSLGNRHPRLTTLIPAACAAT